MNLESLAEQLFNEINNKLLEVKSLETRAKTLDDSYVRLLDKRKEYDKNVEDLNKIRAEVKSQQVYITSKNLELTKKQEILDREFKRLTESKAFYTQLDEKKESINRLMKQLDEKMKINSEIDKKLDELAQKERLLSKSALIDHDRKAQLDERERALDREKERLQAIAVKYQ